MCHWNRHKRRSLLMIPSDTRDISHRSCISDKKTLPLCYSKGRKNLDWLNSFLGIFKLQVKEDSVSPLRSEDSKPLSPEFLSTGLISYGESHLRAEIWPIKRSRDERWGRGSWVCGSNDLALIFPRFSNIGSNNSPFIRLN